MTPILEHLAKTPLVWDGAMGTMVYERGVFINTCYDELCLTRPGLIRDIHAAYVDAGADVIETNTFGANPVHLRSYGLADQTAEINRRAVALAREVAGDTAYVAGSIGPCLQSGQLLTDGNRDDIAAAFTVQIEALAGAGVDILQFETFVHLDELALACDIARGTGCPVAASFCIREQGRTALEGNAADAGRRVDHWDSVDIVGVNCGVGPAQAYDTVEKLMPVIHKPLLVMPNSGMPRDVDGRMIYMSSPEYFTEYAKRFIELGVRGVGGCCGTTPEHIRVTARAVKSLSGVRHHIEIRSVDTESAEVTVVPQADKSALGAKLAAGKRVTSIELLPPRACDLTRILASATRCRERGVDCINIPDGPRASARVSPMVTAQAVLQQAGIEPVLHYCCRDRNLIGMQSDLLGAQVAGVRNILIITGDPPKVGDYPDATGVFDVDSIGLTQVAANLNRGRDVGGATVDPPTGILIGVGANPCAVSMEREISRYYAKLDAGAEFAITQPVFDVEALFRFLDEIETYGRRIPVIAGVWPLVSYKNAEFMRNEVPGVEVPDAIMERMSACSTREEGLATGIAIARETCAAMAGRVAGFQVSAPFGKVDVALEVLA